MASNILITLKTVFGFNNFKSDDQRDGFMAIFRGDRDVLLSLPPAAGKSICFLLPAILAKGKVTLVFTRNNQTFAELEKSLNCSDFEIVHFGNILPREKSQEMAKKILKTVPRLVFIPIAMCHSKWILSMIDELSRSALIRMFVILHAHCISSNSPDNMKYYHDTVLIREKCENIPLIAVTSSSISQIHADIISNLKMRNYHEVIRANWPRQNIELHVLFNECIGEFAEQIQHMTKILHEHSQRHDCNSYKGIVFCRDVKQVQIISAQLDKFGGRVLEYHHNMKVNDRREAKMKWSTNNTARLLVTTADSAIGLNFDEITMVIQLDPLTMSRYCQEIGRAGKRGQRVYCYFYVSKNNLDLAEYRTLLKSPVIFEDFQKLKQFCLSSQCRHTLLSEYLGGKMENCGDSCDFCLSSEYFCLSTEHTKKLKVFNEVFENIHNGISDQCCHALVSYYYLNTKVENCGNGVYILRESIPKPSVKENCIEPFNELVNVIFKNHPNCHADDPMKLINLARYLELSLLRDESETGKYQWEMNYIIQQINASTASMKFDNCIINYKRKLSIDDANPYKIRLPHYYRLINSHRIQQQNYSQPFSSI